MTMVRTHLIIEGLVQGVFFRASTRQTAQEHGVNGWVKNLSNGNVEAVFEGDEAAVRKVIDWCHHGPPGASVNKVIANREDWTGEFDGFSVRYY
ncbi:MAG: acylphosphatase [Nitrospirota bacterium]|nr:acylphosphatase [Nitrospirota bacterium]